LILHAIVRVDFTTERILGHNVARIQIHKITKDHRKLVDSTKVCAITAITIVATTTMVLATNTRIKISHKITIKINQIRRINWLHTTQTTTSALPVGCKVTIVMALRTTDFEQQTTAALLTDFPVVRQSSVEHLFRQFQVVTDASDSFEPCQ
jgi:hypothetical protein